MDRQAQEEDRTLLEDKTCCEHVAAQLAKRLMGTEIIGLYWPVSLLKLYNHQSAARPSMLLLRQNPVWKDGRAVWNGMTVSPVRAPLVISLLCSPPSQHHNRD